MTVKNKEEWIDALRSGDFRQTTGALKAVSMDGSTVGYCCLGVYAEICGIDSDRSGPAEMHFIFPSAVTGHPVITTSLPPTDWCIEQGLTPWLAHTLANMNDGAADMRPHTFAEIADFLEGLPDEDEA